jgi:DNA-binding response OmpR family regulator
MGKTTLFAGRSILIVEDQSLIALDLKELLEAEGGKVFIASSPARGRLFTDQVAFSAAVLDCGFDDDEQADLCRLLAERGTPFMFYTGYDDAQELQPGTVVVNKPASAHVLIDAVTRLLHVGALSCPLTPLDAATDTLTRAVSQAWDTVQGSGHSAGYHGNEQRTRDALWQAVRKLAAAGERDENLLKLCALRAVRNLPRIPL